MQPEWAACLVMLLVTWNLERLKLSAPDYPWAPNTVTECHNLEAPDIILFVQEWDGKGCAWQQQHWNLSEQEVAVTCRLKITSKGQASCWYGRINPQRVTETRAFGGFRINQWGAGNTGQVDRVRDGMGCFPSEGAGSPGEGKAVLLGVD